MSGFNITQELIQGREGGVIAMIAQLLQEAMQVGEGTADAIVSCVQMQEHKRSQAQVRVGQHSFVVHPGCVALIKCKVPADFTSSMVLFEVNPIDQRLEHLDLGDGLVEVLHTRWPYLCASTPSTVSP
ncbi:hypothetical protein ABVT39_025032 [Epinephelus coioides]